MCWRWKCNKGLRPVRRHEQTLAFPRKMRTAFGKITYTYIREARSFQLHFAGGYSYANKFFKFDAGLITFSCSLPIYPLFYGFFPTNTREISIKKQKLYWQANIPLLFGNFKYLPIAWTQLIKVSGRDRWAIKIISTIDVGYFSISFWIYTPHISSLSSKPNWLLHTVEN